MDIDELIDTLKNHRNFSENDLICLFQKASDVLFQEGTLLTLDAPITVCGDVHGQFYDVLKLFSIGGDPADVNYLFLGDYVDRGYYSIETFALLLAYKVKYPTRFFMLRGNHECRQVNKMYGFYEEIISRFGHPGPYKLCNEIFDLLPICAVIEGKIFCVHGGLSYDISALEQIPLFDRKAEIPNSGPISDLCWSDPADDGLEEWALNPRGAGYVFGPKPAKEFLHNNKLKLIARAHQLAMEGYNYHFGEKEVVTVWSAPNYMYRSDNKASVMKVDQNLEESFTIFEAVPQSERQTPKTNPPAYFA